MKPFFLSCLATLLALSGAPTLAQDEESSPPDVETLMSAEDFQASGLDKLSEAERAHLSEWVERYREGAVIGPTVQKPPSRMTEEEREVMKAEQEAQIFAKVLPSFRGWSGKTVFRLDNGQIWQQRMATQSFRYTGSSSEVVISRNMLGGYVLEHVESGRSALVKRVD